MIADDRVRVLSYTADPLRELADALLARHAERLPLLDSVAVLLPDAAAVPRLRRLLLAGAAARGQAALVPPWTGSIAQWLQRIGVLPGAVLGSHERELLLYQAIAARPALRRLAGDPWALVDSLLELFDGLALSGSGPDDDRGAFARRIAQGYGSGRSPRIDDEAALVFDLWQSWQAVVADSVPPDPALAYRDALKHPLADRVEADALWLIGFQHLRPAELAWVSPLIAAGKARVWLQDGVEPDSLGAALGAGEATQATEAHEQVLDSVYAAGAIDIAERARRIAAQHPASPVRGRIAALSAADAEDEAHAVELQVRRWWLRGHRHIGIVTGDRRLARRVRALLERAGVPLQDSAGWRLSTTSAAAALAQWLECVESGFAHRPLRHLLASPFLAPVTAGAGRDAMLGALELSAADRVPPPRGLAAHRRALLARASAVDARFGAGCAERVLAAYDRLEQAASRLERLLRASARSPRQFLDALEASLQALQVHELMAADSAGGAVLDLLAQLGAAAARAPAMSWSQFREWLARYLERHNFTPPLRGRGVELMAPAQARLFCFDAVVVCGADDAHLPGAPDTPPFFNDRVRRHLGLPANRERRAALFHDFRRLLSAAPRVLVTHRREDEGRVLMASPWLLRLRAFHQLAYDDDLADAELQTLVAMRGAYISAPGDPPAQPLSAPRPAAPADRVPPRISAASHQRLVDCPYRYFVHDCLLLPQQRPARDDMEKRDFGERVHRILAAFHGDDPRLPGPFDQPLTDDTLAAAQSLMTQITDSVFAEDVGRDYLARAWLLRWQSTADDYLRQQRKWLQRWRSDLTEAPLSRLLPPPCDTELHGRVDRVDRGDEGRCVIDYKTGATPGQGDVLSGENVQLPFYALLVEGVGQVTFLSLEPGKVRAATSVADAQLDTLVAATRERLCETQRMLRAGAAMPAWGDHAVCERCDARGICRRELWVTDGENAE